MSKSAHMIIRTQYATPENNFLSCMKVENIFEISNNYKLLRKSINSQYRIPKCDFLQLSYYKETINIIILLYKLHLKKYSISQVKSKAFVLHATLIL